MPPERDLVTTHFAPLLVIFRLWSSLSVTSTDSTIAPSRTHERNIILRVIPSGLANQRCGFLRLATRQGAVQVFDMSVPVQKTRGNRDFGVSADIVHRSDSSIPRGKLSKSLPSNPKKSPSLADIR